MQVGLLRFFYIREELRRIFSNSQKLKIKMTRCCKVYENIENRKLPKIMPCYTCMPSNLFEMRRLQKLAFCYDLFIIKLPAMTKLSYFVFRKLQSCVVASSVASLLDEWAPKRKACELQLMSKSIYKHLTHCKSLHTHLTYRKLQISPLFLIVQ